MPRGQTDPALVDHCTEILAANPRGPVLLALAVIGRLGARDVREARDRTLDPAEAMRRSAELDEAWDEACAIAHACRAETKALMADDVTLGRSRCRRPLVD